MLEMAIQGGIMLIQGRICQNRVELDIQKAKQGRISQFRVEFAKNRVESAETRLEFANLGWNQPNPGYNRKISNWMFSLRFLINKYSRTGTNNSIYNHEL